MVPPLQRPLRSCVASMIVVSTLGLAGCGLSTGGTETVTDGGAPGTRSGVQDAAAHAPGDDATNAQQGSDDGTAPNTDSASGDGMCDVGAYGQGATPARPTPRRSTFHARGVRRNASVLGISSTVANRNQSMPRRSRPPVVSVNRFCPLSSWD